MGRQLPSAQTRDHMKTILDYVLSHASGDTRPYLNVSVLGLNLLGLLDSGATNTIVGAFGYQTLTSLGLKLNPSSRASCTVANGVRCTSPGTIMTPFTLMNRTCVLSVMVVPELPHKLILGMDFWRAMGIIPDLRNDVWSFGKEDEVCELTTNNAMTGEQRSRLDDLVSRHFLRMGESLGTVTHVEHEIITDSPPIKLRYYPVSPVKQGIIDKELSALLEQGVIEPSKSAWSAPILMVPKKDGSYRFCVDYRRLNKVTKRDAYPLPYISAILDRLRDAKYLSSLDIKSAYWQVPVAESSREYTAFTVPGRGLFQFRRMPMGLTNAPATWQRLIDRVLGADLEPYVLVYLDDIVIISPDFDTHLEILDKVMTRLSEAGLTVSREKCQFCRSQLKYLGYVVDGAGLRVDPEKVEAILRIPTPSTVSEIRRFAGMASWYRRFVPDFASIMSPLNRLTKKGVRFVWSPECEEAFTTIKQRLVSAPLLTCPDFREPFCLQTDASAYGLGAVLTQTLDGEERVIAFLSRSLTRQEQNYSTTERECLGVIWAVEKLRHYLEGVRFKVITDHASLVWLNRLKDPTGRLARWAVRLQPFDFEIIHRKGHELVVPDCLSRSVPIAVDLVDVVDSFSSTRDKWYLRMISQVEEKLHKFPLWRVENGILYKRAKTTRVGPTEPDDDWKIVVPKDSRLALLKQYHDDPRAGHLGGYKVYWRLRERYIWPKMHVDVARYVRRCQVCAAQKPEQKAPAGLMGTRPAITRPWQMISLDFVGPLPRTSKGNTSILVVSDYFTKYVQLFAVRSATARALSRLVEEQVFLIYGAPQYLVCDNGVQMRSKEFRALCDSYGTKLSYTPLYHPQADPVERVNRVVKTMLGCYIKDNQRKWDDYLPPIGCALRAARSETTGYSPYYVNFGRHYVGYGKIFAQGITPTDAPPDDIPTRVQAFQKLYDQVRKRLRAAQERGQRTYNLRRRPVHYSKGDRVWRRNKVLSDAANYINAKLAAKFLGPFRVKQKIGSWTYQLEDEDGQDKGVWHVQDLKPAHGEDYEEDEV